MNHKFKSASRLSIFFILAVVISGSTLAYFSINNISNLKELTEKRILEEQKELSKKFSDAVHKKIEKLTAEINDAVTKQGLSRNSLQRAAAKYDCINLVFIMNKEGSLIFPNFAGLNENKRESNFSKRFKKALENGEKAEHADKKLNAAKDYYLSSLRLAAGKEDSARALNALGRISYKLNDYENVTACYKLIISDFFSEFSPYGLPYIYYAVQQLIKINDTNFIDETASLIELSLEKMETGAVPLNYYTEELLIQIQRWAERHLIQKQETLNSITKMIESLKAYSNLVFI